MDSIAKRVFRCSWNASNHRFPSTRQAGKDLELVLRRDLKELDLKIEQFRADLTRDMKELEYRITIKLGTMKVLAVGSGRAVKLL